MAAAFFFRAVASDGKVRTGSLTGDDEKAIARELRKQGLTPIDVGVAPGKAALEFKLPSFGKGRRDVLFFTQELSTLLNATVPLDRALSITAELTEHASFRFIVLDILRVLKGGRSLADSLGAHHVRVQIADVLRVRAQAVGKRASALQHAQDVEHDEAETGMLGEFGGDAQGAVQRDGGVEQSGKFLGEEQDVAASLAEGRQLELQGGFPGSDTNVDRGESLFAQFARDRLLIVAGQAARADFAIARHRAEKEGGRHQSASGGRVVEREGMGSTQRRRERRDKRREHKNSLL